MENAQFTFKYTGTSELDVNELVQSLQNVSNSLKEISKTANGEEVLVKIKPFEEGSFAWILAIMADPSVNQTGNIFYNALPGDGIIEKFKSLLEFVSDLRGKDLKDAKHVEGNNYEFTNENGEVEIIEGNKADIYFQNTGAVTYIENLYVVAGENDLIDGIKILDKDKKEIATVKKESLKAASKNIRQRREPKPTEIEEVIEIKSRIIPKKDAHIAIAKPDLAGSTLWKVVYEGHEISVKIEDEKFKNDVNQGKYFFANGSLLKVDLSITQIFNSTLNTYTNKSYSVVKFHNIVERGGEQPDLFE
jgi:hypothetical protein